MMLLRLLKYIEEGISENFQEDGENCRLSNQLMNE